MLIPNTNQPTIVEARPVMPHLINSNIIAEAVRKHFGVQLKPIERLVYEKPYLNWIDKMMPLPKGYKVLDFTTFSRDDNKSTMEHISRFMA